MTNDVVVSNLQVTKLTPAVIEAPNIDDLVANTDKMLAKYREFPVSEESYDTAKQQRSVLNATIKDIADQRKKIEKELLGNWADIKPKMMLIEKAGKAASDLMKEQMVPVENERKERRKAVVMNDVTALANDQGVDWARIQFNEKWLNKTYSRNDMIKEIDAQIVQLKKDDELLALQTDQIEIEASGLGIDPTPYISMLGLRDFADIKAQM
ncbi:MAG TPA: replication protein, partial [Leuconostoc lactis]|nr:replication protein [Leuconostoc lactis]